MTFLEILNALYEDLGYSAGTGGVVSSDTKTRLSRYVNDSYRQIMRLPGMEMLRFETTSLTTTIGEPRYALAPATEQILALTDLSNQRRIVEMSRDDYLNIDPGQTVQGTPWAWIPAGLQAMKTPLINGQAWVRSNLPADNTQRVTGTYLDTSGLVRPYDVALNGVSNVQMFNLSAQAILTCSLTAVTQGDISFWRDNKPTSDPSNVLYGYIWAGQLASAFYVIRLWPTPSSVITYQVDSLVTMTPLVNDWDVPRLPVDFHNVLVDYARMREYELRQDDRFQQAQMYYQEGLKTLKNRVNNPPDYRPVSGKYAGQDKSSDLGPWYPSGRW